jgi:hypothetical protein
LNSAHWFQVTDLKKWMKLIAKMKIKDKNVDEKHSIKTKKRSGVGRGVQ